MVGVIFASEYRRRIKTCTFVVVTLLVPLAIFAACTTVTVVLSDSAGDQADDREEKTQKIAVLDSTGDVLAALLQAAEHGKYQFIAPTNAEAAKQAVAEARYYGLLTIPSDLGGQFNLYVRQRGSIGERRALRRFVLGMVREVRLSQHELSPALRAVLDARPSFEFVRLTDEGEDRSNSVAASVVAVVVGSGSAVLLMFFSMLYGGTVMQAVMEEKASRMAEIVVSIVRPFELLMGKILAVAAMGATQVAAWIALSGLLFLVAIPVFGYLGALPGEALTVPSSSSAHDAGSAFADFPIDGFAILLAPIAVAVLLLPFGFLIHASLFASLGALFENAADAQNTTFVAMLPMIASMGMASLVGAMPDSAIIAFGSFFPFSAPAILPARMLVTEVPVWHVAIGIVLSVVGSLVMVWLAGRILRGTLLSYGQTPKLRDVQRILFGK